MPQIQIVSNYFPLSHNLFKFYASSDHLQKNESSVFFFPREAVIDVH